LVGLPIVAVWLQRQRKHSAIHWLCGHALWGIGKNLMIQEHYEEAMPWLQESLGIFENADALPSIATVGVS
jgi:hypothetical protein